MLTKRGLCCVLCLQRQVIQKIKAKNPDVPIIIYINKVRVNVTSPLKTHAWLHIVIPSSLLVALARLPPLVGEIGEIVIPGSSTSVIVSDRNTNRQGSVSPAPPSNSM
jgi:hypothetical protein